jgi:hypothetical protein
MTSPASSTNTSPAGASDVTPIAVGRADECSAAS